MRVNHGVEVTGRVNPIVGSALGGIHQGLADRQLRGPLALRVWLMSRIIS